MESNQQESSQPAAIPLYDPTNISYGASAWWNIRSGPAVPPDWLERNQQKGVLGSSLNPSSDLLDRAVGTLLGVMIGDILGTPFEGYTTENILNITDPDGRPAFKNFFPGKHMGLYHLSVRYGMYTDDTNSTLALAASITECSNLNPEHAAKNYGKFWQSHPERGYPGSAKRVMKAVLKGDDITKTGTAEFEEGSFANGGVMRIAPVGIAFRNATEAQLYEAVRMAIISSHVHPEAIDAAFLQAYSIAWFLRINGENSSLSPSEYLEKLEELSKTPGIKTKIGLVKKFLNMKMDGSTHHDMTDQQIWETLGSDFQIRASEAFPCALWAFVSHWYSDIERTKKNGTSKDNGSGSFSIENSSSFPEECLMYCVKGGGDTDTVASIAGALCGAFCGTKWIPLRWYENCENGARGRDYAIQLAKELAKLDLTDVVLQKNM